MSFQLRKTLICTLCDTEDSSRNQNVPDDLFDLLCRYQIPQIHWICKACISKKCIDSQLATNCYLEDDVNNLKKMMHKLDDEVAAIKYNVYDFANRSVSARSPEGLDLRSVIEPNELTNDATQEAATTTDSLKQHQVSEDAQLSINSFEDAGQSVMPFQAKASLKHDREGSLVNDKQQGSLANESPKRCKKALQILDSILKNEIKINDDQAAKSISVVDSFMKALHDSLKKDEVYKNLYQRDFKTGSSYNDLRISSATEYDINIVFTLPQIFEFLELEFLHQTKAFAKIKLKTLSDPPSSKSFLWKFFKEQSTEGYLNALQIKSWFHGLIDKFLLSKPQITGLKSVINSESGPARTIKIETDYDYSISLDLAPVFVFDIKHVAKQFEVIEDYDLQLSKQFCFFVPKQYSGGDIPVQDCNLTWRADVPEIERRVLHDKRCAKSVIKLLKLLRDREDWKRIASYHLNTVILWELHKFSSTDHWKGNLLFERFLEALKKLQCYLKDNRLPYFLDPDHNLFSQLGNAHCENMSYRLQRIISDVESDPNSLKILFHTPNKN